MANWIKQAESNDAHLVHQMMLEAFEEYRYADIPSSALNETVHSVRHAIESGEEEAILFTRKRFPWGRPDLKWITRASTFHGYLSPRVLEEWGLLSLC